MKYTDEQLNNAIDFLAGGDQNAVREAWKETPETEKTAFVATIQEEALVDWNLLLDPHAIQAVLDESY